MFKMIKNEAEREEAIFSERWTRIVERTLIAVAVIISCELFQPEGLFDPPARFNAGAGSSLDSSMLYAAMQQRAQIYNAVAMNSSVDLSVSSMARR